MSSTAMQPPTARPLHWRYPPGKRVPPLSGTGAVESMVADSGPGVPSELTQRIFDPFFTTREVGDGTGLGLHFSRQVAYDHGGSLDLVASPGWGACFKLWLPSHRREIMSP